MTDKQLLSRLARARNACFECLELYAQEKGLIGVIGKIDKCDICKKRRGLKRIENHRGMRQFALGLQKEIDKKAKKKAKVKKSQTPAKLWETASTAMQEYYRSLGSKCAICPRPQAVMHHWQSWGRSSYLRFNEKNLVPLCKECHCKFHAGDIEAHYDIRLAMSAKYGYDWEREILALSHMEFKLSAQELRDYLNDKIRYYNNLRNA